MVATQPFGHLRMRGGRYEQGGLPVAAARELERYERLVQEVARSVFLSDHPKRKRTSRRFTQAGTLFITAIGGGSVTPLLERPASDQAQLIDAADYVEQARVLINSALSGVRSDNVLINDFPVDCLQELSQLGRSLQGDERFEFGDDPDSAPTAILDQGVRAALQSIAELDSIEMEIPLVGHVSGLRTKPQSFDFLVAENQKQLTGLYTEPTLFADLQAVIGYGDRAPLVSISAVVEQSASGELKSVVDVLGVETVLPLEWSGRLQELSGLQDGWLEEGSPAPREGSLRAAESLLLTLLDNGIERPGIYALARGGVQLEWKNDSAVLEVELPDTGALTTYWYSISGEDEAEESHASIDGVATVVMGVLDV